ncbi:MAG: bifunctional folylpolyglutamate synthase/dihydrofolate synthase [Candidatus Micrarchaeota archaeon]|nr:bifunctional folylpolyglutamate synthase/dihydrofolate synthase [Candidatus Micrarchaeota archaeon]
MARPVENEYGNTLNSLFNLRGSEDILGTERIEKALSELGNPQNDYKTIHIAGTNGKGSVAVMVSSVLQRAGFRVGLYTSPHLVDFRERIRVNGKKIGKKETVEIFQKVKKHESGMTFFEFATAMAFLYFKEKGVDYAVIEVGLGGRLDATNVIVPEVSVITNISNDHEELLGDTIERIAYEKACIIKKGVPVVTGAKGSALEVIKDYAKKKKSRTFVADKVPHRIDETDEYQIIDYGGKKITLPLLGNFQLENASVALKTLEVLNIEEVTDEAIIGGMWNAKWPARMQVVARNPMIILDGAHNLAGAKALADSVKDISGKRKIVALVGIKKGKDYRKILKEFERISDFMIFSESSFKPHDCRMLLAAIKGHGIAVKDIKKALGFAKYMAEKNGTILVAGSLYFVGDVMHVIWPNKSSF